MPLGVALYEHSAYITRMWHGTHSQRRYLLQQSLFQPTTPERPKYKLRPYQDECITSCLDALHRGVRRQVVSAPTGAGKTVIFANLIPQLPAPSIGRDQVLVLAHRDELVRQNAEKIGAANPDLRVGIEMGKEKASPDADVVSASVATLGRAESDRIKKFDPARFKAVIIDEMHHSAADTYRRVIDHFGILADDSEVALFGFSATVRRADRLRMDDIYEEIVYHRGLLEMIDEDWLARLRAVRVSTGVDLDSIDVSSSSNDFSQPQLEAAVNTPERNRTLLKAWRDHCEGKRHSTLIFCVDRQHMRDVTELFVEEGISAQHIHGETPKDQRPEILRRFGDRKFPVLVNVGVMTEGTDVPCIDAVIMARPTRSSVLYQQTIGRGLRLYDDKPDCLVIDLVDVCQRHSLMTTPALFGLHPDFDLEGEDATKSAKAVQQMSIENPTVLDAQSIAEAERIVSQEFDPFSIAEPPEEVRAMSNLLWREVGKSRYRADFPKSRDHDGNAIRGYLEIQQDMLGNWDLTLTHSKGEVTQLRNYNDLNLVMQAADKHVSTNYSSYLPLMKKDQNWHADPATEAQREFMKKLFVTVEPGMTKLQAKKAIDAALSAKRKRNFRSKRKKKTQDVQVGTFAHSPN